jgi:hypothetical protein
MAGGTAVCVTSRMKITGLLLIMRTANTEERKLPNERENASANADKLGDHILAHARASYSICVFMYFVSSSLILSMSRKWTFSLGIFSQIF